MLLRAPHLTGRVHLSASLLVQVGSWIGGLAWAATLWLRSPGTPVQDEIGHFLMARDAWVHPVLALDEWGRPLNTLLYMPAAAAGWGAARAESLALSALTVLFATRMAHRLGSAHWWLTPLFCWFQPWFAGLSFVAITEVPFALLAACGWAHFLDGRWISAALAIGSLPLVRHEGVVLVAFWTGVCLWRRRPAPGLVAWVPLAAYYAAAWLAGAGAPFEVFLAPVPSGVYGSGTWLHYVPHLAGGAGPPLLALATAGLFGLGRCWMRWLTVAWFSSYLAVHVVLFRFGLFGSGGYWLFLMPLAPPLAVLATFGVGTLARAGSRLSRHAAKRLPGAVAAAAGAAVLLSGLFARPHPADREQIALRDAADWIRERGLERGSVYATHVWMYYYLPLAVDPRRLWTEVPRPQDVGSGTILVWDRHYSQRQGWDRRRLRDDPAWEQLAAFDGDHVIVFRRR